MVERRNALFDVGIELEHVTGDGAVLAATDDMLDAAVAAWTAMRLLGGAAHSIPDPPELNPSGRAMAIWY